MERRGVNFGGKEKTGRIHRILYSFGIPRVLVLVRRFAPKREDTVAAIIGNLSSVFGAPKKAELQKGKAPPVKAAPRMNLLIVTIVILALVGFLVVPLLLIPVVQQVVQPPVEVVAVQPTLSASIRESGIIDSGTSQRFFATASLYGSLNASDVSFAVYRDPNPDEVFILRTTRLHASYYNEFRAQLKESLASKGMSLSEMTIEELLLLPNSSRIVLVVPTGYMPEVFVEGPLDMKKFAERGNVLVFIGYPPTEGIIKKDSPLPQPVSAISIRDKFGIEFDMERERPDRLNFTTALYNVRSGSTEKVSARVIARSGEASVQWGGQGYAYFIATTVDDWWPAAGKDSGRQLADVIIDAWWNTQYAAGNATLEAINGSLEETATVFTQRIPDREVGIVSAYGRLKISAMKTIDNKSASIGKVISFKLPLRPKGSIENEEQFISSLLTDRQLEIRYSLNESPELRHIYFQILNSSGDAVSSTLMFAEPVSLRVPQATYRFMNNLHSGNYILKVTDEAGAVFAQSYLRVPVFSIRTQPPNWDLGQFVFFVHYEDEADPYRGLLKHIKVSLDGKDEAELDTSGGALMYNASYAPAPGTHTITIRIGADTIVFDVPYAREKSLWERPEYVAMAILGIVFFSVALFIRPREDVFYSIDVPDFPPLHSIAIPVKRDAILGLFETINRDLRWQYTPLTIHDLKAGFSKLLFRGRPITIGDYNLEHIMDDLAKEGYVKSAIDFYGLESWESQARKSMYALAMQRALRDLFVTEGIPFMPFGQNPLYDTAVSVIGEKVFIHIYEDESVIEKAIATAVEGRTVIIFEDVDALKDFTRRIHGSAATNVTFKLLLDSPRGNIQLAPLKKLVDILNKKYALFYY